MARGRKAGPTRMDLRRQSDAAEAREGEVVEDEDKDDDEEDDDEEDDDEEAEDADEEASGDDEEGETPDEDDEDAPKKKKAKPKAKPKKEPVAKKPAAKRVRAVKEVRMKAMWVVFDNGSKQLETFPFNQKAEAEEFMAKKVEEKKATFYLQLVKEPIE